MGGTISGSEFADMFANSSPHFGNDGIDYAASNLSITHYSIHDNLDIGDGNHEDAMQGQIGFLPAGATVNHFSNVLIDSNLVIRQTDPKPAFPTYLQGIDAFDSDWTNVIVTNNVVITSACWGIGFPIIHNSLIANNTVVPDGLVTMPGGCTPNISVGDKTHEGSLSSNTAVRNNLASQIDVDNRDSGVEADHNIGLCCKGPEFSWYINGVIQYLSKVGPYTNGNIIDAGGAKSEFVKVGHVLDVDVEQHDAGLAVDKRDVFFCARDHVVAGDFAQLLSSNNAGTIYNSVP